MDWITNAGNWALLVSVLTVAGSLVAFVRWARGRYQRARHLSLGVIAHGHGRYTLVVQWRGHGTCTEICFYDKDSGEYLAIAPTLSYGEKIESAFVVPPQIRYVEVTYKPGTVRRWKDRIDLHTGQVYRIQGGKGLRDGAARK